MENKKICIIGAGIGGLTTGVLLTKKGYKVTIYEKESIFGGRALSFQGSSIKLNEYQKLLNRFNMKVAFSEPEIDTIFSKKMLNGYQLDLGFHIIGGGITDTINEILSKEESKIGFLDSFIGFIENNNYNYPFLSKIDKIKVAPNIIRLIFANEKKLKEMDKQSIAETIKKYGNGKMKLILEVFSRSITTINDLEKISSGEMLRAQKNLYKGAKPVAYPEKGLINICKSFAAFIIQNGGKIKLNKTVEEIIIKDKKAIGIKTDNKKEYYDIIISNALVQNLFNIVDEKHFSKEYVKELKNLDGTGSLCAYYSFKEIPRELIGKSFHFIERDIGVEGNDAVGMIDFMISRPESKMAAKDSVLVQSYIICTSKEAKNPVVLKKLKQILDKNLNVLIPEYKKNLNWAIYPTIWHLDGVAKTIEKDKVELKTPIDNLFLVGDCVKAPGIGFNCALNSAIILSNKYF